AGLHGQSGVAVIGLDDGHDLALAGRVARGLDGDVDGLGAARSVDGVVHARRRSDQRQRLGERGARQRGKVVVAHVEARGARLEDFDELRMTVAEVVGAAVQVQVEQAPPVHVVQVVALAAVDHEVDAHVLPVLGLARVPEYLGAFQELLLAHAHDGISVIGCGRSIVGVYRSNSARYFSASSTDTRVSAGPCCCASSVSECEPIHARSAMRRSMMNVSISRSSSSGSSRTLRYPFTQLSRSAGTCGWSSMKLTPAAKS